MNRRQLCKLGVTTPLLTLPLSVETPTYAALWINKGRELIALEKIKITDDVRQLITYPAKGLEHTFAVKKSEYINGVRVYHCYESGWRNI